MADQQLVSVVDRLVRLEEDKKAIQQDINEILKEAASSGHSAKALRVIVKRRLETASQTAKRLDTEQMVELLEGALGDFSTSPLGRAAIERAG